MDDSPCHSLRRTKWEPPPSGHPLVMACELAGLSCRKFVLSLDEQSASESYISASQTAAHNPFIRGHKTSDIF